LREPRANPLGTRCCNPGTSRGYMYRLWPSGERDKNFGPLGRRTGGISGHLVGGRAISASLTPALDRVRPQNFALAGLDFVSFPKCRVHFPRETANRECRCSTSRQPIAQGTAIKNGSGPPTRPVSPEAPQVQRHPSVYVPRREDLPVGVHATHQLERFLRQHLRSKDTLRFGLLRFGFNQLANFPSASVGGPGANGAVQ
jgi:hypothetical protein